MAYRIQIRRGTSLEWEEANPVLLDGEFAIEKDTRQFKIGDGNTAWNGLEYATQGEQGKSLLFAWDGTQLGIKQEGETNYIFKDLRGPIGETNDLDERRLTAVIEDLIEYKESTNSNAEEIVEARHGETSLSKNIRSVKNNLTEHTVSDTPHEFNDLENNKKYTIGFQLSEDGQPQIIYKEVI